MRETNSQSWPHRRFDAAIVGGGPAGLFAALALCEAGASVCLIAGAPAQQSHFRRTTALLGGSVAALELLGVWHSIRGKAAPLRVMRLVDATNRLFRAPIFEGHSEEIGRQEFGFNIENSVLVEALQAAVASRPIVVIEAHATSVQSNPEHVVIEAGGIICEARLAIGAEGRRSLVREAAGIALDETRYPQSAVTATFLHARPHGDVSTEFHTADGPCTLVPLPGNRSSLVWVVKPVEADRLASLDDAEFALAIEKRTQSLLGKVTVEGGRGRFDLAVATPARFGMGRIALAGEAAHVIPPIGAQGLNLGLRDGAMLADLVAEALAANLDPGANDLTSAYDRARRPDIIGRTLAVDALNRSLLSDFLPVHSLRSFGLFALDRIAPLRRAFMREGLEPRNALPRLMRGLLPRQAA